MPEKCEELPNTFLQQKLIGICARTETELLPRRNYEFIWINPKQLHYAEKEEE